MSRIDEALKRAIGLREDRWDVHGGSRDTVPVRLESVLDRYSSESARIPQGTQPRRAPVIAPSAAPSPDRPDPARATPAAVDPHLITAPGASTLLIEQYRRLAASLHDAQLQRGIKTLLVSSALPREGKTIVSCNLALTLSQSYQRKVLLIDADLRRPAVHDMFGLRNSAGLTDVLRYNAPLPLIEVSSHLSVLPAGQAGGSHLAQLSSGQLAATIRDAAERFDWILLDTPPVGLLPDAQHVATVTDAVVFVIAAGATPYGVVQSGISDLGAERVVGVVLNRVDPQTLTLADYYAGYYPVSRGGHRI